MQDVRPVDPKKERIRKTIVFFLEECQKCEQELKSLRQKADALMVVQDQGGMVADVDFITLRNQIKEVEGELLQWTTWQKALPTPCSECNGSGIAGHGMAAHTCGWCKGAGFLPPGGLRLRV